ncbi:Dicer-like protein 1 [Hypoxylon texense]
MSEAQREAKAEAAKNCSWRGDSPEPELDDLAHHTDHHIRHHDEVCSWRGDSPEPELDDLAHHAQSPDPSPTSQVIFHADTQPIEAEPLDAPKKRKKSKKPEEHEEAPKELEHGEPSQVQDSQDQTSDIHSEKITSDARPHDNQPEYDEKQGQEPDKTTETLREKVTHGVQQVYSTFQHIIQRENQDEADPGKPSGKENDVPPEPVGAPPIPTIVEPMSVPDKTPKDDKEKAKMEKEEAKKAQKEKKAKEKEEKKRLKKEKEEAKKQKKREHKERCHTEHKEKKSKGKRAASPPPDLLPGADVAAAADPHLHPGCKICQNPEEQGTIEFLRQSLENWQGLPSFHDLTEAAKTLIGLKSETEHHAAEENPPDLTPEDQQLLDHIAEHIDAHIRHFLDPKSSAGGNPPTDKASPHNFVPHAAPSERPAAAGKQHENGGDGGPNSHGLDGNRDWPMTTTRGHTLRNLESTSPPEFAVTQPPSRGYSPLRISASRCVSPWCEELGFNMDDSRPFPKRTASWSRRG